MKRSKQFKQYVNRCKPTIQFEKLYNSYRGNINGRMGKSVKKR